MAVNAALITRMVALDLHKPAILVRLALGVWANPDGCSDPSQKILAQVTGLSERTVGRQLRILQEAGLIEHRQVVGHGRVEWRLVDPGDPPEGQPRGEEPEFTRQPTPVRSLDRRPRPDAASNGAQAGGLFDTTLPPEGGGPHHVVIEIRGLPSGASVRQGA